MKFGEQKAFNIPATIDETIYKYLKNAIVEGELKPKEKMKEFYKRKDFPLYYEVNLKVHDVIWKACGNKHLYQNLSGLSQKLYIHKNLVFKLTQDPKFFAHSYQDHLDLQKTIEQRDIKAISKILNSHWASGFLNTKKNPQKEDRSVEII